MLRIAYITSRFPKISETFVLYEIIELKKLGFDIDIFPLVHEHEEIKHLEVESLRERTHYYRLFSKEVVMAQVYWLTSQPMRYLSAIYSAVTGNLRSPKFVLRGIAAGLLGAAFARKMRTGGVRHVHAHWATHPTLAAYVINRLTGIPYSFTAHAHDIYVDQTMLREKINQAAFVIAISQYNRRFLVDLFGQTADEKVQVIHCGIDPERFRPGVGRVESDELKIICVASLEEKKGHVYLLQACRLLRDRGVKLNCVLVGDGDLRADLQALVRRLDLGETVRVLGRQSSQRVSELLRESDVMVLPSIVTDSGRKEGIPVALMEALASEMPVVATDISGVSELIEDGVTGLLVKEKDAAAIADALEQLARSREFGAQLGRQGRDKVLREFNLGLNSKLLAERIIQNSFATSQD